MKLSTTERIMKIWGWVTLVMLLLGIPSYFINYFILKMEIEFSLFIPLLFSTVVEILLSIAFIRCKKDAFLVVAIGGQVLYRVVSIIMNISYVSVLAVINLVIYIALLVFVAVCCISKLSAYREKIRRLWFVPCGAICIVSVIGFVKDIAEKFANTFGNAPDGAEIFVQTFSLGIGASSHIMGILQYFLLCYWIYKKQENQIFNQAANIVE